MECPVNAEGKRQILITLSQFVIFHVGFWWTNSKLRENSLRETEVGNNLKSEENPHIGWKQIGCILSWNFSNRFANIQMFQEFLASPSCSQKNFFCQNIILTLPSEPFWFFFKSLKGESLLSLRIPQIWGETKHPTKPHSAPKWEQSDVIGVETERSVVFDSWKFCSFSFLPFSFSTPAFFWEIANEL